MSRVMFAVFAFVAMIAVGSAVDVRVSAGNGQDVRGHYMGGSIRFDPSVFEESFTFDFSGEHEHSSGSIHSITERLSIVATRTDDGNRVHVKGVFGQAGVPDTPYDVEYTEE